MRTLRFDQANFEKKIAPLRRTATPEPGVQKTVSNILSQVARHGDSALLRYAKKFDHATLTAEQLRVTPEEIAEAQASLSRETLNLLKTSRKNVFAFAKKSLRKNWSMKNTQGAEVGERFDPFDRVGIYVPGGTAPLVSTAIMTCTLAQAAAVPQIVACTPCGSDGKIHPALLTALHLCGATEIYRIGGAQAIAALAYGTASIPAVRKIFGPGNAYVVEAKRQVVGQVAIDLLPGPSEVLILADSSARPDWIATDLLAQSEHGHGSQSILLTDSEKILKAVESEVKKQSKKLSRQAALQESLASATLILLPDIATAIDLANDYAAEHVSIVTRRAAEHAALLTSSGAIFLGGYSPIATGDFLAGPSHTLPTGGAGKSFAGLTADQFQRRTSILRYDRASLKKSAPIVAKLAALEGLDAHANSATIRHSP
ncbi:MAG: histidinol dehydrogenase [Chthoniobacterales bacterium]